MRRAMGFNSYASNVILPDCLIYNENGNIQFCFLGYSMICLQLKTFMQFAKKPNSPTNKKNQKKNPRENSNIPYLCEIRWLCKMHFLSALSHKTMIEQSKIMWVHQGKQTKLVLSSNKLVPESKVLSINWNKSEKLACNFC